MAEEEQTGSVAKPKSAKSDSIGTINNLYFNQTEHTFQESAQHPDSTIKPWNPDVLVQQDFTYGVYEDMMRDDQVDVALKLKKDLVVGSGWSILHEDEELTNDLENLLNYETDRPFSEILYDMIQAYEFGFSISEKLFKTLDSGLLALKNIKPRHPSSWLIHTDEYGNVSKYEQMGRSATAIADPDSIIHYINEERHQNPYGRSDLYAAYQAWLTKRHITRFYAIFLENAAGPKPVGQYDSRVPQSAVDDLFTALKSFQTKTAMVIPKEIELSFLEAKNTGEPYIKGINLFNMFIGRALFIPDLLGFSGGETGGGSHSLGKEQISLFYKHIHRRRSILESIIDRHVVRPLCVYNYGPMEKYPQFRFKPLSDEDAVRQADLWIRGVQGVKWTPTLEEINHFRNLVKFPDSDILELQQPAPMIGEFGDDKRPEAKEGGERSEEKESEKKEFGYRDRYNKIPGTYKNKVDFKLADQTLKSHVAKMMAELTPLTEEMFEDLYSQIQKKKILPKQDIKKAKSLKLKHLDKMQMIFKKHFRATHSDGKDMAKTEVNPNKKFVSEIPYSEAMEFLEDETFKYVGDWQFNVLKNVENDLITAMKDGKPLSQLVSVWEDEDGKLKSMSDVSLERYARTKTTEIFNKGRLEYFESTGAVAAYQYSAILDDATSEICEELDGKIFEEGEYFAVPPLHFNCRSMLIPITKFEPYDVDNKTNSGQNIEKFLEENVIDKGFALHKADDCFLNKHIHTNKIKIKKPVELKPLPQITDANIDFSTEVSGNTEATTYSLKGKPFQISVATYDNKNLVSLVHKRLDGEAKEV